MRDAPLAESAIVGFAIGLAVSGVRAVVELEFFDFIGVAMDQVFNQAAKLHYFTGGRLQVPLVIRVPIVARMGMGPQHSQSLESWFMHIPGLKIAMPSDAPDAYGLMRTALRDHNPVLFIENVRLYGRRAASTSAAEPIPFGTGADRARRAATPPSWRSRAWSHEAVAAADELAGARHLGGGHRPAHPGAVRPRHHRGLGAEDAAPGDRPRRAQHRGVGAEIADAGQEDAFDYLDAPVERVCGLDVPVPSGPLLDRGLPDAGRRRRRRRAHAAAERVMADAAPAEALPLDGGGPVWSSGWWSRARRCARATAVAIVETDKAEVEVEAPASGSLEIVVGEGEIVPVETVIARAAPPRPAPRPPLRPAAAPAPAARRRRPAGITAADLAAGSPPAGSFARGRLAHRDGAPSRAGAATSTTAAPGGRLFASPAARRVARELGVDLAQVRGRGPGGRIVAADVAEHGQSAPASAPAPAAPAAAPAGGAYPTEPPAPVAAPPRAARARPPTCGRPSSARWCAAGRRSRTCNVGGELDAEGLVAGRRAAGRETVKVTYTDLLLLALAARAARRAGARGHRARGRQRHARHAHRPQRRRGDARRRRRARHRRRRPRSGSPAVARERARIVEAARSGRLERRDLAPGACTLSNLGAYPVDFFTPVLSGPQAALVATGRIAERVVPVDGLIGVRHRMWANVCVDHRAADGEAGGRLLAALERRISELPTSV